MNSLPVSERPLVSDYTTRMEIDIDITSLATTETDQPKILIVDDRPDNLRLLYSMLTQAGYDVRRAINGATALMGVRAAQPDLILLDINMPGMDGYEVCQHLKQEESTADIPVIFLSALDEGLDKVRAFSVGGADYITKPFEVMEVLARVKNHLQAQARKAEIQQLNTQLEERVLERTSQLLATKQALMTEVCELGKAQDQLAHMAWHDPLTDLPNRAWLMKVLRVALEQVHCDPEYQFAVLFLDCDRFKLINDSLGHLTGDQLLVEVAQRLTSCLDTNSTLARFGGDEFTLFVDNISSIATAEAVAQQLLQILEQPFYLNHSEVFISASIGIAIGKATYASPEEILRDADIAMYRSKSLGRARYICFDAAMHAEAQRQLQMETDLRLAIERQEFYVEYQPIISLQSMDLSGFEALLRWQHPTNGIIEPEVFVPVAEDNSLIVPLGLWMLEEVCQQFSGWQGQVSILNAQAARADTLRISVNLSVKQFAQADLVDRIDYFLAATGLKGYQLTLEITESALMADHEATSQVLTQLRDRNIYLAIDDFGTGYSSLSYLHRFPVNLLKIDQMFINRIADPHNGFSIVEATLVMAHSLGIKVVAEGVETAAQAKILQQLGCDYAQGFWFAPPLNTEMARQMLLSPPSFDLDESE